ncbi:MipA/OmpV family protein [Roseateles cellulosilyticus]|uniref:MipA/OmpV family protein n=1 Tax=Pelomonas cellulosilytica TaxID=2906762 RepID=A0ABS8Y0X9_9BURK|nr:MipA/OmpV family protein [Pelomonas sp. P8]MCE4556603.1 MipA/OmpV family protein [Pelomonas sp. P8]
MKAIAHLSSVGGLAIIAFAAMVAFPPEVTATELSPTESSLTLGAGIGVVPDYLGSNKNKAVPMLLLDYQHRNGLFASTQRGIGWAGEHGVFHYSFAVNGRAERTDQDHRSLDFKTGSSELLGMGRVKASVVGQGTFTVRLGDSASVHMAVEAPLTQRDNGRTVQFGGDYTVWRSARNSIALNGSLDLGDRKYMQTYFGVTQAQSLASGYANYTPAAGLYKANLSLGWTHRVDTHWRVVTVAGAERLLSDAGDSPLARRKTAPQAGVLVSYSY